jgi:cytochrome c553
MGPLGTVAQPRHQSGPERAAAASPSTGYLHTSKCDSIRRATICPSIGGSAPSRGKYFIVTAGKRKPAGCPSRAPRRAARCIGAAHLLLSLILCPAAVPYAQPTQRAPDTMAARLRVCTPCHGPQGEGTNNDYFPRLAGKPAGYLMNQLVAFRDGRRRYPPMNYLLEYLSDAYLQKIADYFAALRPTPAPRSVTGASPTVLARGRALVTGGDPGHAVPPCSQCHGPALTGMEPGIPGLVGLRASYISAQLGAFRYGTRTAAAPDCMQLVAASLSESDVTAVAAWLASLPVPPDPTPVPKGTLTMPLVCGSEPR